MACLGEIVTDVNQRFSEDLERSGRFMTLFLARIDRERKKIEWVRAGHDPALLYGPVTEALIGLKGKGLPLGVVHRHRGRSSPVHRHGRHLGNR